MSTAIVASIVLLWITVIALVLALLGLSRQVGVLLERIAPAGALMTGKGLRPGEAAPELNLTSLGGDPVHVGGARTDQRSMLVFFLSPTCPMCDAVVPAVRSLARSERGWLDVVLASDGDDADHEGYVRRKKLQELPYVGQLPHAVLIDESGKVAAAGLINTREHLDSLLEAKQRGVASLQEYIELQSQRKT
jgi:methylamine dehydrogenase accessory protein MauD